MKGCGTGGRKKNKKKSASERKKDESGFSVIHKSEAIHGEIKVVAIEAK